MTILTEMLITAGVRFVPDVAFERTAHRGAFVAEPLCSWCAGMHLRCAQCTGINAGIVSFSINTNDFAIHNEEWEIDDYDPLAVVSTLLHVVQTLWQYIVRFASGNRL